MTIHDTARTHAHTSHIYTRTRTHLQALEPAYLVGQRGELVVVERQHGEVGEAAHIGAELRQPIVAQIQALRTYTRPMFR